MGFLPAEGGFSTTANFDNPDNLTQGFSYVATRTSPTPLTCTNQGFWTNPPGADGRPGGAEPDGPARRRTGVRQRERGRRRHQRRVDPDGPGNAGHWAGYPGRQSIRGAWVNGVARTSTVVQIFNDDPPNQAVLDVTFSGVPIAAGDTVTFSTAKPVGNAGARRRTWRPSRRPASGQCRLRSSDKHRTCIDDWGCRAPIPPGSPSKANFSGSPDRRALSQVDGLGFISRYRGQP